MGTDVASTLPLELCCVPQASDLLHANGTFALRSLLVL